MGAEKMLGRGGLTAPFLTATRWFGYRGGLSSAPLHGPSRGRYEPPRSPPCEGG